MRSYREAFSGLPREVWFLAIVMFINRSGSMVLPFMTLYVKNELQYSEELAGLVIAYFGVGSCFGSLLGGWMADRFGPIRVQMSAFLANAIGFVVLSQVDSYALFSMVLFLMSVIGEAFRPANVAAIAEFSSPETHSRAYALNRMAINLGFSIGPPLGGILATVSYFWLFQIDAATCLAAGATLGVLFWGKYGSGRRVVHAQETSPNRSPWTDLPFLMFLFLTVISFGIFFQLVSIYPMYLEDEYALKPWQIGMLLGLNTVGVVVCEMVLVNAIQDFSKLRLIAWGTFLMCFGMSSLIFGNGFWFAASAVLIWTLGEMLAMPQALTFVAAHSGPVNRARYMGAYTMCVSLAFVLASAAGSWCYGLYHDLIWQVGLVISFAVLSGFLMLESRLRLR